MPEDFARYHPAGTLGLKLMKISEIMRTGGAVPTVSRETPVRDVLVAITEVRAGAAVIVSADGALEGIFTDGDLRRQLKTRPDILETQVGDVMTSSPLAISADALSTEAASIMREKKIDEIPVIDDGGRLLGMVDIQDLLAVGLI